MTNDNKKKLFEEFQQIPASDWEELIQKDLKGQDYDKRLVWKTAEGISVRPYFRQEDIENLEAPLFYENAKVDNSWEIRHFVSESDPLKANEEAHAFIQTGVNAIGFDASEISDKLKMAVLLKDIDLEKISISFVHSRCNRFMRGLLNEYLPETAFDPIKVRGFFDHDPYSYPLLNGDFPDNPNHIKRKLYELFDMTSTHLPAFRALNINGSIFHNAGANAVQEVAYSLALAHDYLYMLHEQELKIDTIAPLFQITLSAGSSYFMEIAKFRAVRVLWARIIEEYKAKNKESYELHLHAVSSEWNKSIYDPHTNILRHTTEAMSAIIGGVDILTILPFDMHFKKADDFSKRIAKNIQLLLKDESYLDKVVDPSAGSYYIEKLTDLFAAQSWELFKKIEATGGFLEAMKAGQIQAEIEAVYQQRIKMLMSRKDSILGLNSFPNIEEKIIDKVEIEPLVDEVAGNTPIMTIPQNRKAVHFEQLRLRTEDFVRHGGKKPVFFMLPVGNPAMASARQIFSRNFFGVAGFDIIENARFTDINKAVEVARNASADVIVICSSDDEYKDIAPRIAALSKEMIKGVHIVVAGNPVDSIEELRQAGIDDFIHIRSDLMSSLEQYQKLFGILKNS